MKNYISTEEQFFAIGLFIIGSLFLGWSVENPTFSFVISTIIFFGSGGIMQKKAIENAHERTFYDLGFISPKAKL